MKTKEITAKQLERAILKVLRFAACPVSSIKLHTFVSRELGAEVSQDAVFGCLIYLHEERKIFRLRGDGAFGMVELA